MSFDRRRQTDSSHQRQIQERQTAVPRTVSKSFFEYLQDFWDWLYSWLPWASKEQNIDEKMYPIFIECLQKEQFVICQRMVEKDVECLKKLKNEKVSLQIQMAKLHLYSGQYEKAIQTLNFLQKNKQSELRNQDVFKIYLLRMQSQYLNNFYAKKYDPYLKLNTSKLSEKLKSHIKQSQTKTRTNAFSQNNFSLPLFSNMERFWSYLRLKKKQEYLQYLKDCLRFGYQMEDSNQKIVYSEGIILVPFVWLEHLIQCIESWIKMDRKIAQTTYSKTKFRQRQHFENKLANYCLTYLKMGDIGFDKDKCLFMTCFQKRKVCQIRKEVLEQMGIRFEYSAMKLLSWPRKIMRQSQQEENRQNFQYIAHRGLANIGNTCYMNSALQCLHRTTLLQDHLSKLAASNLQMNEFVKSYVELELELSEQGREAIRPTNFKWLFSQRNIIFRGNRQQDSCEFLCSVINQLHESLNTVTEPTKIEMDSQLMKKTDDEICDWFIRKDACKLRSKLDQIFFGRYRTSYTCCDCQKKTILFQKFCAIHLPLLLQDNRYSKSLLDSLNQLERAETLKGQNAWYCSNCKEEKETERQMQIFTVSKVVIFCLKRFTDYRKIDQWIEFPLEIEESRISKSSKAGSGKYSLYGVINHYGSLYGGHYSAYSRDKRGQWWLCDDSWVIKVTQQEVLSSKAYVLLYELKEN